MSVTPQTSDPTNPDVTVSYGTAIQWQLSSAIDGVFYVMVLPDSSSTVLDKTGYSIPVTAAGPNTINATAQQTSDTAHYVLYWKDATQDAFRDPKVGPAQPK